MRIALTVKNSSRVAKPIENDVIIYDGNIWYVTTKENLLKEANELLDQCKKEIEKLKAENAEFKRQIENSNAEFRNNVAKQLLQMSNLIEKLYSK